MIGDPSERSSGLRELAERHGVSLEGAAHMLRALQAGGGTMAQFDHPEFGGMGQWFSGGMVMVGRMNDHALKARVCGLCEDLAAALPTIGRQSGSASSGPSQSQSSGFGGGFAAFGSGDWWPDGLGRPASVGSQNATRYAYFPESRRLAVESGGRVALYDTGEHVITGASQQQGGASSFVFSGPNGTVSLDALRRVEAGGAAAGGRAEANEPEPHPDRFERPREGTRRPAPRAEPPETRTASAPSPSASPAPHGQSDVLSVLERLSELHRKGVLTDAEFSGKKAELLARL